MFLHLGGDTVVARKDVIAIFDLDITRGGRVCDKRFRRFAEILCLSRNKQRKQGLCFPYFRSNAFEARRQFYSEFLDIFFHAF